MKTTTLAGAFAAALLALTASRAQDLPDFESGLEDARARLELTDGQAEQLRPIFEAWFEAQAAILEEHGIGDDAGDEAAAGGEAAGGVDIAGFQALQRALGESDEEFEAQVAAVLSDAQMEELDALREEGRAQLQETILARRVEEIGERIGLEEDQLEPFGDIYAAHVESQMAILDRHGIQVGGGRTRLRTLAALRRDMQAADDATLGRLASVLSDAQLAEYRAIQEEQRERNRESIR